MNDSLLTLPTFAAIDTIVGAFKIDGNIQLDAIDGYAALSVTGGNIITNNSLLNTITGFNNVVTNNGRLFINNNDALLSINAFTALENQIGDVDITYNAAATSIQGFTAIDKITGDLNINDNIVLTTFDAFNSLDSISLCCRVALGDVTDFSAIMEIEYVGDQYTIRDNNALTNTDFLINLLHVGGLEFDNNPSLSNITQPNTNPLDIDNISIVDNPILQTISGFNQILSLVDLTLEYNELLTSISSFNQLDELGNFRVEDHPNLLSIGGFTNLENAEYMDIISNGRLKDVDAFNNNGLILESLTIIENDSLHSITGFQNPEEITEIRIEDNPLLTNLMGFYNLTDCSDLTIRDNDNLNEFCPFYNLVANDSNSVDVDIDGNDENPDENDILDQGDCFLYLVAGIGYTSLADATLAAMAFDTISYVPRDDPEFDDHQEYGHILLPIDVVFIVPGELFINFNDSVTVNGTIISKDFTRLRFDDIFVLNGTYVNKDEAVCLIEASSIINGTFHNELQGELDADRTGRSITINGTVTNGPQAFMELNNLTLNGTLENSGALEIDSRN